METASTASTYDSRLTDSTTSSVQSSAQQERLKIGNRLNIPRLPHSKVHPDPASVATIFANDIVDRHQNHVAAVNASHSHLGIKLDGGIVTIGGHHQSTSMTRHLAFGSPTEHEESRPRVALFKKWCQNQVCMQIWIVMALFMVVLGVIILRLNDLELDNQLCELYARKKYNESCEERFGTVGQRRQFQFY